MKKELKALKKQVKATATKLDIISLITLSKFGDPEKVLHSTLPPGPKMKRKEQNNFPPGSPQYYISKGEIPPSHAPKLIVTK